MLEVTDAVISVWGPDRVGMHLAPRSDSHGISDSNPEATFGLYCDGARTAEDCVYRGARVHGRPTPGAAAEEGVWRGIYREREVYAGETANAVIERGEADAVAFGKLFIANPDLPVRFATGAPLNEPNPETFYSHGPEGYVDYPSLQG